MTADKTARDIVAGFLWGIAEGDWARDDPLFTHRAVRLLDLLAGSGYVIEQRRLSMSARRVWIVDAMGEQIGDGDA